MSPPPPPKKKNPADAAVRDQPRNDKGVLLGRIFLAVSLLAVATILALQQPPRANPFVSPPLFSWDWWINPIEVHATSRLPVLTGTLTSLAENRAGNALYVGGQDGLLLRSGNGGRSWEQIQIPDSLSKK